MALRWCPGHNGVKVNEEVDRLPTKAANKKSWARTHWQAHVPKFWSSCQILVGNRSFMSLHTTRCEEIGQKTGPETKEHMKALPKMRNKHSIPSITQLCNRHMLLVNYLASRYLMTDSTCVCRKSAETVKHCLLKFKNHEEQRNKVSTELKELEIPFNRPAVHQPEALELILNFTSSTWKLKSRLDWAESKQICQP